MFDPQPQYGSDDIWTQCEKSARSFVYQFQLLLQLQVSELNN